MKLKEVFSSWQENRKISKFIGSVKPGFNYYKNHFNPRNHIEVYFNEDDKTYILRHFRDSKNSIEITLDKEGFRDKVIKNHYERNMEKVNYLDISTEEDIEKSKEESISSTEYTDIRDKIQEINKTMDKIRSKCKLKHKNKESERER